MSVLEPFDFYKAKYKCKKYAVTVMTQKSLKKNHQEVIKIAANKSIGGIRKCQKI